MSSGGAVCLNGASAELDSVTFTQNYGAKGGGLYLINSTVTLAVCEFDRNDAASGGGLCSYTLNGSSTCYLEGCNFTGNTATDGGAINMMGSGGNNLVSLRECRIVGNSASKGGGIYMWSHGNQIEAVNCSIDSNTATSYGGGIYSTSDAPLNLDSCTINWNQAPLSIIYSEGDGFLQLTDCEVSYNQIEDPENGIVTVMHGSNPGFTRCVFDSNQGNAMVFVDGGGPVLDSCLFSRNITYRGALVCIAGPSPTMANCTFSHNYGNVDGIVACYQAEPIMDNCIVSFSSNVMGVYSSSGGSLLECCNIYGNEGGDWVGSIAGQYGIDGNISLDPEFCDTSMNDYRLQSTSPCAPANNDCNELIGAFGVGCGDYLCGDANSSGDVDIDDVVYLINYIFGGGPPPDPLEVGDVDCSGFIDIDDVVYLINYIFAGGPEPCASCP
jgi:predicted outer membrane repeat protein